MVDISTAYTRFGDAGQIMVGSGETVAKTSLRVASYGEIDEVNAHVGALRESNPGPDIADELLRIQHELFDIGAELSCPGDAAKYVKAKDASWMQWYNVFALYWGLCFATALNYEFLRLNPDADGASGEGQVERVRIGN